MVQETTNSVFYFNLVTIYSLLKLKLRIIWYKNREKFTSVVTEPHKEFLEGSKTP